MVVRIQNVGCCHCLFMYVGEQFKLCRARRPIFGNCGPQKEVKNVTEASDIFRMPFFSETFTNDHR